MVAVASLATALAAISDREPRGPRDADRRLSQFGHLLGPPSNFMTYALATFRV